MREADSSLLVTKAALPPLTGRRGVDGVRPLCSSGRGARGAAQGGDAVLVLLLEVLAHDRGELLARVLGSEVIVQAALEVGQHGVGGGVAVGGVAGEGAAEDRLDVGGQVVAQASQRRELAADHPLEGLRVGVAGEQALAGEQLP